MMATVQFLQLNMGLYLFRKLTNYLKIQLMDLSLLEEQIDIWPCLQC